MTKTDDDYNEWGDHFEAVLNRKFPVNPPNIQPGEQLTISNDHSSYYKTGSIKNYIKKEKSVKLDNIPPEALKQVASF